MEPTPLQDLLQDRDSLRQQQALSALRALPRGEDRDTKIKLCCTKAEELRTVAEEMVLHETRQTLLQLALSYERMAHSLARTRISKPE